MKLCFLAPGNSIHTRRWAESMISKGCEVHLITLHKGDVPGTKVYYLPARGKWTYLFFLEKIKSLIRAIRPDVVHAHYASSYGFLGACSGFHPFVVSVWGSDLIDFPKRSLIHKKIVEYVLRRSDRITVTSKMLKELTGRFTFKRKRITQIPFGIDLEKFKPEPKNTKRDAMTIGVIKRLDHKYGIEYLIKGFATVEKRYKDARLLIVGDGPLRAKLKRLTCQLGCEKKIEFVGSISHAQVPDFLNLMDIFVMPSVEESFGVAALEASACGLPVVASNTGGIPEVVLHNKTGFLIPPKDHYSLAAAIAKLIENQDLRRKFGEEGRKFVSQRYDWLENFQRMYNLYQDLVNNPQTQ